VPGAKSNNKDYIMRTLVLTAAVVFAVAATAGASARTRHHHPHEANAAVVTEDAIPADTLSAHDAYIKNLHDAGYNPHNDIDAHGNIKIN
jgi:hypothetical protein